MGSDMARDRTEPDLDRELEDLPPELRWREWMRRIEAVLFASATPVPREDLARVVGQGASVDLLVEDLVADLEGRAFELAQVAGGWIFRTRAAYAPAICTAADVGEQDLNLREFDVAVLAAIAYHQPVTRDGLKDIFGKDIGRDLIGRLHARGREWAKPGGQAVICETVNRPSRTAALVTATACAPLGDHLIGSGQNLVVDAIG